MGDWGNCCGLLFIIRVVELTDDAEFLRCLFIEGVVLLLFAPFIPVIIGVVNCCVGG